MDKRTLPSLYGLNEEEINLIIQSENVPAYRAKQLTDWLYKKYISDYSEASNLPPALRESLASKHSLNNITFSETSGSSNHESQKYLFKTTDDRLLESVLIEQKDRKTVCVSTQLGCKVGCPFCASGKGKFGRDLTAGEIIEQVILIEKKIQQRITNIVFMGMGEPLDNFEATMKALEILQASWGLSLGARRITVSTSGITPKILEFVKRSEGKVRLSISLHSSQEEKRNILVPINRKYPLKELIEALRKIHRDLKRNITFEYTLIDGENDSVLEAHGVAGIAKSLKAKVNIIPYNPISEMSYQTPTEEKVNHFAKILEDAGVRVIIRQTAGRDINAACGQLRLDRE